MFIKAGLQLGTPLISAAVATKTKNPQMAQTTTKFLRSKSRGKIFITNRYAQPLVASKI